MIFHCARPTSGVRDRALREHRRSSGSTPSPVCEREGHLATPHFNLLVIPHFALKGSSQTVLHCAHRTSTVLSCAFCEQEGWSGCAPPILPLTEPPLPGYDPRYSFDLEVEKLCAPATIIYSKE